MAQTNVEMVVEIMKLVNNMADSTMIEQAILKSLQLAYRNGADSIRRSPDYHYREDMGR